MTQHLQFSILGPVAVQHDGVELDLGGRQQQLVLALLLAKAGRLVTTFELTDMIWENDPPPSAANVVHRCIGMIRRILEPGLPIRSVGSYLTRHTAGYRLHVSEESLDLMRFRCLVAAARGTDDEEQAVRDYTEALSLWHGPCALGLEPVSRTYPVFVALEAEHQQIVREAADRALSAGLTRLLLPVLRLTAGRNPLDEALQARFILSLAANGSQAEAVTTFLQVRRRLDEELGITPCPELRDAYDRLLHQRTSSRSVPARRRHGGHLSVHGRTLRRRAPM
jgi:DNA-binding SARP family transcriptional activator